MRNMPCILYISVFMYRKYKLFTVIVSNPWLPITEKSIFFLFFFFWFHIQKSEELKKMGNLKFKNNQYEDAVKFYSRAIKY